MYWKDTVDNVCPYVFFSVNINVVFIVTKFMRDKGFAKRTVLSNSASPQVDEIN